MRGQKGITLVALIITIVVLLILAMVAIGSVNNTGIIDYAKNAANDYNAKKTEEEGILTDTVDLLANLTSPSPVN